MEIGGGSSGGMPNDAPGVRAEVSATGSAYSPLRGLKVLVVEDDAQLARLALRQLGSAGCKGTAAYSVDGALALLDELEPDVMLIDVHLSSDDADGLDFVIEARARGCDALVVVLSSDPSRHQLFRASLAGVDDFIVKGDINLVRELEQILTRHRSGVYATVGGKAAEQSCFLRTSKLSRGEIDVVVSWAVAGFPAYKVLADVVDLSEEYLRRVFSHVQKKLGVDNLAQLANLVTLCSMFDTPPRGIRRRRPPDR